MDLSRDKIGEKYLLISFVIYKYPGHRILEANQADEHSDLQISPRYYYIRNQNNILLPLMYFTTLSDAILDIL